jgi:hypothetical protein
MSIVCTAHVALAVTGPPAPAARRRAAVKVSASRAVPVGLGIDVIGQPSGLPAKRADGARITGRNTGILVANRDTCEGKCNVVHLRPGTPGREQPPRTTVFIDDIP